MARALAVVVVGLVWAPGALAAHIHASFRARSYRPGQVAALRIVSSPSRSTTADVIPAAALRDRELTDVRVRPSWTIALKGRPPWHVYIRFGHWNSGVYLVRLSTKHG